jgi:hypothetical protein
MVDHRFKTEPAVTRVKARTDSNSTATLLLLVVEKRVPFYRQEAIHFP